MIDPPLQALQSGEAFLQPAPPEGASNPGVNTARELALYEESPYTDKGTSNPQGEKQRRVRHLRVEKSVITTSKFL